MTTTHQQLLDNLGYLKLNEMKNHIDEVVDYINRNNTSFEEGLIKLTNYEIERKEIAAITSMVKVGAFPYLKEMKDFDFSYQEDLNKVEIMDFLNHRFISNKENIIFLGSSGVGKTHLATAIGISAAKKRISTYFIKCNDLIMNLKRAKLENRLDTRLKHYASYGVLIIDELGYLPIDKEDSKLFFQIIDKRYETKSTIITTNINFNRWDEIFLDSVIANAILDRVLHHSHVVHITGKSYRLKDYYSDSED